MRATDANIAAARSELGPKLSVMGNVQGNIGRLSVAGTPPLGIREPQSAVLIDFEWPLYEGGLLQNKLHLAESQREEAASELKERTDQALREVALAYDSGRNRTTAIRHRSWLQTASQAAFRSASDSNAQGLGTFTDAASAQTGPATARLAVARAHAQSLINAAALALAIVELTSSADFAAAPAQ